MDYWIHIMRISDEMRKYFSEEVERIRPGAQVYLLGLRADDEKRGGDIDIMVLTDRRPEFEEMSFLRTGFWKRFGEQKIDLVSFTPDERDPFKDLIMGHAVEI